VSVLLVAILAVAGAAPDASWRDRGGEWRAWRTNGPAAPGLTAVELEAGGRRFAGFVDRHALVQLGRDGEAALARAGLRVVRPVMPSIGLVVVEDIERRDDGLQIAARLAPLVEAGAIARAIPDLWLNHRLLASQIALPPNDEHYPAQWFWARLEMEKIWARETGSSDTTIVVVDNGCDARHPDLQSKLDPGRDVLDGDDDPSYAPSARGNNHGTACAGLVGAAGGNGVGVIGGCPGCRVRCVRLLADDPMAPIPISADVDAFQFALDTNAAVVSNSWGFVDATPVPGPLADAIVTVERESRGGRGAVVLFAAGNDDRELDDDELTGVEGVITVGAVNQFGDLAPFSNRGRTVDVVAPTGTYTTDISGADGEDRGDYTDLFGGTSSACPVAAGVVGLLVSAAPEVPAADISAALLATAKLPLFASPDGNGHDLQYGFGEIRPAAALERLVPTPPPMMAKPGCSCDVTRRSDGEGAWLTAAALVALALLRRRRDGETLDP
jgi:MYXO-CTERM domain-containing protein